MLVLGLTLLVCAVLVAGLVVRYDMYDREPWWLLILAAAIGAVVMWPMGEIELAALGLITDRPFSHNQIAVAAGVLEELAKLTVVVVIALAFPRHFNDPMDGIIYGSIVGLGMAVEESFYFMNIWQVDGPLPPATEIVRLFGHLVMGGITGFGVGLMRLRLPRWPVMLIGCVGLSIGLHIIWDMLAFAMQAAPKPRWWQTVGGMAVMFVGMLIYGGLVMIGSERSRQHFDPDSPQRLGGLRIGFRLR